jgi:tetratricopeptide (TPR) repeat protein
MRTRHFEYFFSIAQDARLFGDEKGRWLDRLEAELDNLRSALAWSLEANIAERGSGIMLPILDFYWHRGFSAEALEWMEKFLELESPASPLRALLLQKAGWLTRASGNFGKADVLLRRALEMALEIGDKNRAALALMDLGLSTRDQGNHDQAISFFSQALTFAQESGENRTIGVCLYSLAQSYDLMGNLNISRRLWEQGLSLLRAEGDKAHIAWGLEGIAGTAYLAKDFASAFEFHLESLKIKVDVMDKLGIAYSFEGLAQVSAASAEPERAASLWGAANRLREALNVPLESSREDLYTSLIPAARSQIGAEGFDKAWKKGKEMTLNEAIEFALTLPED